MNPDDILNDTISLGGLMTGTISPSGWRAPNIVGANTISMQTEDALDKFAMNKFTIDHKVTAQELLKLQEVAPDFAKEIKENIAKNLARDISNKVSYTKKHDKDTDVHHFIGRVWVFTEEELKQVLGVK
jgi:hypothetical protein